MIAVRSFIFNLAFYLVTTILLIGGAPFFLLGEKPGMLIVRTWGRVGIWLMHVICGTRLEIRGAENIPAGGAFIASKHQSTYETFALVPQFRDPTFVIKRELLWVPLFGVYMLRTNMILVARNRAATALRGLVERCGEELARGRQVVVFPEGTRRAPGAPPEYQTGIALLYRSLKVPVIPMALNSGLYWPRRRFLRQPGTIVFEFLPAIPPGLEPKTFLRTLTEAIETASTRLIAEAATGIPNPPIPPQAKTHLANERQAISGR